MATHQVTPHRKKPQPYPKPALYETIASLNRDLGLVIDDLNRLRDFNFSRRDIDGFVAKAEHLRSRANSELLERQLERELMDDSHFWFLEQRYEDRYKDPNDVLIDAERRLEEMTLEERRALTSARETRERRELAEKQLRTIVHPAEVTESAEPPSGVSED
jgi:hypothetical protein